MVFILIYFVKNKNKMYLMYNNAKESLVPNHKDSVISSTGARRTIKFSVNIINNRVPNIKPNYNN